MATLSPLLRGYDQVILDLDGCVWLGDDAVEGSVEAIAALRKARKPVAFATNNSWHSSEEHVTKLWRLGVQASVGDVVTVGGALAHLLAETRSGRTAFVIGSQVTHDHVVGAGLRVLNGTDLASRASVVVVSGSDRFGYDDLRVAALAARRGGDLLATGRDPTMPRPDGPWPGTGALLAAVETASGRTATIVGKPQPQLFYTALDRLGAGRTLVIGDRLDTDVAGAAAAGLDAALVNSGDPAANGGPSAEGPRPVAIGDNLAAIVLGS
ncbi:MAG: HAD-IIA family hydrolase [Thermoleophilaceae bacterium]